MIQKEIQERKKRIIEYARKVVQYPEGSKGYDPIDMINLKDAIEKHDKIIHIQYNISKSLMGHT